MARVFGISFLLTIAALVYAWVGQGFSALVATAILIAIEIAFSFDNAIVNAKVLARLSAFWQQLFLTVGMVIAILGMRLLFPIVIVMVTAHLPWSQVIDDALHHPHAYGQHLAAAHNSISAFGGSFLLVLTLYFLLDDARREVWLPTIEKPLQRLGGAWWLPPVFVIALVAVLAAFTGGDSTKIITAGIVGAVSYSLLKLGIDGLGKLSGSQHTQYAGWGAFSAFMYLQILDASFSFDGVLGAFAITDKILLIALGLGVGALWVRSLTVFMVRRGTLGTYKYLEHGAHYAILVLAAALLGSLFFDVPDALTGVVGLGVIGASFIASQQVLHDRRKRTP